MSALGRRYCVLVNLLAILWTLDRIKASRRPWASPNDIDTQQLNTLGLIVAYDVAAEMTPLIRKLASQIDQLDSRLTGLNSRLNSIEAMFTALGDTFSSRLDNLTVHASTLDFRLDNLVSVVNSSDSRLDSVVDDLVSIVNSSDNQLGSRLDELAAKVDSHSGSLDGISSRLGVLINWTLSRDCSDLPPGSVSGIHKLRPGLDFVRSQVAAYCDLDTDGGGWTVFQRREDIQPRQNFDLDWSKYRAGFGELDKEFWWGLEKLHQMTNSADRQYELRVELADWDGERRYAVYRRFRVASEADGYRLTVGNYTGDAGNSLSHHSGREFTTKDRDQDSWDRGSCAQKYRGGWWYFACHWANLNGPYLRGRQDTVGGINWFDWRGNRYSLKETVMMVRPVTTEYGTGRSAPSRRPAGQHGVGDRPVSTE